MIKTTCTPHNTDLHLSIPKNYVGKRVEVLLYTLEEIMTEATGGQKKMKASDYAGSISKKQAHSILKHVKQSRKEWERDI